MDFPKKLLSTLEESKSARTQQADDDDATTNDAGNIRKCQILEEYNQEFETESLSILKYGIATILSSRDDDHDNDPPPTEEDLNTMIERVVGLLQDEILCMILSQSPSVYIWRSTTSGAVVETSTTTSWDNDKDTNTTSASASKEEKFQQITKTLNLKHSESSTATTTTSAHLPNNDETVRKQQQHLLLLSEYIRSCKNIIKWYWEIGTILSKNKRSGFTKNVLSLTTPIDSFSSLDMIHFYITLLKINAIGNDSQEDNDNVNYQHDDNDEEEGGGCAFKLMDVAHDNLARKTSGLLYQATRSSSSSEQSISVKKALDFISTSSSGDYNNNNNNETTRGGEEEWISLLMKLLISPQSIPFLLTLMIHVQNLMGSRQIGIVQRMDHALEQIEQEDTATQQQITGLPPIKLNLLSVIVSTLTWLFRSNPSPFIITVGEHDNGASSLSSSSSLVKDQRAELIIQILRTLYAMKVNIDQANKSKNNNNDKTNNHESEEAMTQLGIILVDILHLPNVDERTYEAKLDVLALLIDPPTNYDTYILVNKALDPILTIFWIQVNEHVVVEKSGILIGSNCGGGRGGGGHGRKSQKKNSTVSLFTVLIVLYNFSKSNQTIRKMVKDYIFPPNSILKQDELEESATAYKEGKNMKPMDAPKGSFRWKVIKLMTDIDSNVKRVSCELLWILCNEDPKEVTRRVGFGNAVHLLGLKNFVKIPEKTTTTASAASMMGR